MKQKTSPSCKTTLRTSIRKKKRLKHLNDYSEKEKKRKNTNLNIPVNRGGDARMVWKTWLPMKL